MQNEKIFIPEAFGAVADGITDDSVAINAAIKEASKCGGRVEFAKDSVYFIKTGTISNGDLLIPTHEEYTAFCLRGAKGVTLKGENTLIRIGDVMLYFSIADCSDITLDGFTFETCPHVAFRGKLQSVSHEKVSAVIKTDYEIPLENGVHNYIDYENGKTGSQFAMPDDQWRTHLWLRKIEKNNADNEYTVWFNTSPDTRRALRRVAFRHCDIIMPTPNIGHKGRSFLIHSSKNIHIQNCNIKEASMYVGAIKGNIGEIFFENVKMCAEKDQTIPMLGWRDGFHCKDNLGAIHWKNCEIGRLYDDAFNISCITCVIDGQPEPDVISIKNREDNGVYYKVGVGEELSVYDTFRGTVYCEANRITEVIKQEGAELLVRLEKPIAQVDSEHTRVMFDSRSAPGSTIENCRVRGTVRIRGPITVKDTKFEDLFMMWTENEDIEGPVPRNMLFENCSFKGVYPIEERYLENYFSFRTTMVWPGTPDYKLKNIRLVNCDYDPDFVYVEEGNDVKFLDSLK